MTTYYDAPEPDDLQRRCWAIDDGQCRLYNGHTGGHDFGHATPDRAGLRAAATTLCNMTARHIAGDTDVQREDVYAAIEETRDALATPDRADPCPHRRTGPCIVCMGLATPDRADPRTPKPCGVVFGNTDDGTTGRCGVIGYGHDGPHVAIPDRADPERRVEGLLWRWPEADLFAALDAEGWFRGLDTREATRATNRVYARLAKRPVVETLNPTEPSNDAALTPPPAEKAVLTANEARGEVSEHESWCVTRYSDHRPCSCRTDD